MKKILNITLVLLTIFILWNSSKTGNASESISMSLTQFIEFLNPFNNLQDFNHLLRKLAHFSEYFAFGLVLFRAKHYRTMHQFLFIPFYFLPIIDECYQLFIPGRAGSVIDIMIDYSGILSAYLFLKLIQLCIKK